MRKRLPLCSVVFIMRINTEGMVARAIRRGELDFALSLARRLDLEQSRYGPELRSSARIVLQDLGVQLPGPARPTSMRVVECVSFLVNDKKLNVEMAIMAMRKDPLAFFGGNAEIPNVAAGQNGSPKSARASHASRRPHVQGQDTKAERAEALGISFEDYSKAVDRHPEFGRLTANNLAQKATWFRAHTDVDIMWLVNHFHQAFGYSLEGRIVPRYEYVKSKPGGEDPFALIPLVSLLNSTDKAFISILQRRGLAVSMEDYRDFKDACMASAIP